MCRTTCFSRQWRRRRGRLAAVAGRGSLVPTSPLLLVPLVGLGKGVAVVVVMVVGGADLGGERWVEELGGGQGVVVVVAAVVEVFTRSERVRRR